MMDYPIGVSLEEAQELALYSVMSNRKQLGVEIISVEAAYGRVAAEDIRALENIPAFDKSPYDGYALMSSDTIYVSDESPVTLKITEEIPAGTFPKFKITSGYAAKILTGAPIPEGADAVIPYEKTVFDEHYVQIKSVCKSDSNIVHKGEDISIGDLVIQKGKQFEPSDVALLAGLGISEVKVFHKLHVGILCTGSELVDICSPITPGKIRNTNYYLLAGGIQQEDMYVHNFGLVEDDARIVADKLLQGLGQMDCMVTTGGASVGDYDVMKEAVELAGGELLFWKIRMKPGSAAAVAVIQGKPVFILSGNPGAAAVTFQMLVLPVLRYMSGNSLIYPRRLQAKLLNEFKKASPNRRFLRGQLIIKNGEAFFETGDKQSNGMVTSMKLASALGEIPSGSGSIPADELIFIYDLEHFTNQRGMNR